MHLLSYLNFYLTWFSGPYGGTIRHKMSRSFLWGCSGSPEKTTNLLQGTSICAARVLGSEAHWSELTPSAFGASLDPVWCGISALFINPGILQCTGCDTLESWFNSHIGPSTSTIGKVKWRSLKMPYYHPKEINQKQPHRAGQDIKTQWNNQLLSSCSPLVSLY